MTDETNNQATATTESTGALPVPVEAAAVPQPIDATPEGDPCMIVFMRGGREMSAMLAEDRRDAILVAIKLLVDQRELTFGDQIIVTRL